MWERFKWLFVTALKFKRTAYPRTKWGVRVCLASLSSGIFSIGILDIQFKSGFVVDSLKLVGSEPSLYLMYLSFFLAFLGMILIFSEWNLKLRHTAKVIISSMPGVSMEFPDEILDPTEKAFCREPVTLGVSQTTSENIEQQVRRYNAELEVDIFKRFILHDKCQKLYIGGLARIPFLVAYGATLRNISANIFYFDKFHRDGSYALLSDENSNIKLEDKTLVKDVNSSGDIALAIGLTTPISIDQIPPDLQDSITLLSSNRGTSRNLIKNQENLQQISAQIGELIDALSALPNCNRVHLFLSVQSALAIEVGRRYQEGTQQNWVIHNFDPTSKSYTWGLELTKTGVSHIPFINIDSSRL